MNPDPDSTNIVQVDPAGVWTAPLSGWTDVGVTDGGVTFTPLMGDIAVGIQIAEEGFRRLSEAMTFVMENLDQDFSDLMLLRPWDSAPETRGEDTEYCGGQGGRWSDLMAQIEDLVDEGQG